MLIVQRVVHVENMANLKKGVIYVMIRYNMGSTIKMTEKSTGVSVYSVVDLMFI